MVARAALVRSKLRKRFNRLSRKEQYQLHLRSKLRKRVNRLSRKEQYQLHLLRFLEDVWLMRLTKTSFGFYGYCLTSKRAAGELRFYLLALQYPENSERKRLLEDETVVAAGAGATAVVSVASLSKAVPAFILFKFATYKISVSFQIFTAHLQRIVAMGINKILSPSKFLMPKVGTKTVTAEKIRVVTVSV